MHQTIKKLCLLSAVSMITAVSSLVHAEPSERVSAILTRQSSSGLQLRDTMSKNLYRQEAVQVPYTVQEPYQAQETYYESVPYQEQETYYEQVPYTETEYYTDYEDYWDREYKCENRNRSERVCRDKESCHVVPGRGPDGGPRRECTKSPECETVNRSERVCDWEQVRKSRPVQKTRTVTRYRDERRTRTVTRYRQEERTRTVTRYRDKQVCCKTEYVQVFDRQYTVPVSILFPAGTELVGAEKETFTVVLSGTEAAPVVSLTPKETVFGYKIARQQKYGGGIQIELQTIPRYTVEELGAASIKNLRLDETAMGSVISFSDEGLKARVQTRYLYQIREVGASEVLVTGEIQAGSKSIRQDVAQHLEESREYQLELRLLRQGLTLAGPVNQVLTAIKKVTPMKSEDLHMRRDQIRTFEVRGRGVEARLFFIDMSPQDEGVKTIYKIEILLGGGRAPVAATREIAREAMPMGTKNFFKVSLLDDMGISSKELTDKVRKGKTVTVQLTTTRENPRLNQGTAVVLRHQFVQEVN